jgi:hypothetical protein
MRRRDPVEADQGEVAGHVEARRAQRVEHAERELVVVTEDRLRWVGRELLGDRRCVPPPVLARVDEAKWSEPVALQGIANGRAAQGIGGACARAGVRDPPIATLDDVIDGSFEARRVVAPQDASRGWLGPVREGRIVGLDEDDAILREPAEHLGGISHAGRERDAVGAMLDQDGQRTPLTLRVVESSHHEDGVAAGRRGLLEAGGHLAVNRIGQVIEQQAEDVGPTRPQAPGGSVRHVAELLGSGLHRGSSRFPDPGVVLERA